MIRHRFAVYDVVHMNSRQHQNVPHNSSQVKTTAVVCPQYQVPAVARVGGILAAVHDHSSCTNRSLSMGGIIIRFLRVSTASGKLCSICSEDERFKTLRSASYFAYTGTKYFSDINTPSTCTYTLCIVFVVTRRSILPQYPILCHTQLLSVMSYLIFFLYDRPGRRSFLGRCGGAVATRVRNWPLSGQQRRQVGWGEKKRGR